MLKSLEIESFRGIKRLEVTGLAPVTVITGDNGAGKTTVLEAALALLGRNNPMWVVSLQAHRGFRAITQRGPNYSGLFHGFTGVGTATVSGRFSDGKTRKVVLERSEQGPSLITDQISSSSTESEVSADLICRAYVGRRLENTSKIVGNLEPGKTGIRLTVEGAKPVDPIAVLMHPVDRAAGSDEEERFGQMVLSGGSESLVAALKLLDMRITGVQFLRTQGGDYFVVEREREIAPLGLLGGGINSLFRFVVNFDYARGGLLGIDEVDNGFHHSRHDVVFQKLFELSLLNRTQLFVTTHSAEALKALVDAARRTKQSDFAVIHLRRDPNGEMSAKVFNEEDAIASVDLGFELR